MTKPKSKSLIEKSFQKKTSNLKNISKINFINHDNPIIDIFIPFYKDFEILADCLYSIYVSKNKLKYNIYILNDFSPENIDQLKSIKGLNIINNKQNLGFIDNCNQIINLCQADFFVLLNSDTLVTDFWLDELFYITQIKDDCSIVAPKFLNIDGSLQEAGGIIWKDGSAWNYGRNDDPNKSKYNYVRSVDYASGACLLINTNDFKEVKGFSIDYRPAYCEDSDLSFKLRKLNKNTYYTYRSKVYHIEGVSHGKDANSNNLKSYQIVNQKKFYNKWRGELEKNHFANGFEIVNSRDRSINQSKILILEESLPKVDKDAGSNTLIMIIESLIEMNFNVKIKVINYNDEQLSYKEFLTLKGIEYIDNKLDTVLVNCNFDYVFVSRPFVFNHYFDTLNTISNKIIYYGHDIHFLREKTLKSPKFDLLKNISLVKSYEKKAWLNSSIILYPSDSEVKFVKRYLKSQKRIEKLLPYYFNVDVNHYLNRNPKTIKNILFVGSYNHLPNQEAIDFIDKEIAPKFEHLRFNLVGSGLFKVAITSKNIFLYSDVSSRELNEFYLQNDIFLCPLFSGAGVKKKILDAMSYGLPILSTRIGLQDIYDNSFPFELSNNAGDFIKNLNILILSSEKRMTQSEFNYNYVKKNFSKKLFMKYMRNIFCNENLIKSSS